MTTKPIILGVDASAGACSAALSVGGEVIGRQQIEARGHATTLLALADQCLSEAAIARSRINAIAYGCGPGGFTGVRVSAGVAQGMAMGLDCPGIPVSTLRLIAADPSAPDDVTAPVADWIGIGSGFLAYPGLSAKHSTPQHVAAAVVPDIRSAMAFALSQYQNETLQPPAAIAPVYLRNQIAQASA
jgi:tRNA threonylcarbamoyladenosine biosynthesis protein TsaB